MERGGGKFFYFMGPFSRFLRGGSGSWGVGGREGGSMGIKNFKSPTHSFFWPEPDFHRFSIDFSWRTWCVGSSCGGVFLLLFLDDIVLATFIFRRLVFGGGRGGRKEVNCAALHGSIVQSPGLHFP